MMRRLPVRGYTLIELVVALAVLALASTMIAEGLRFGLRAWSAVNTRLSRSDAIATAQQTLRGRIQQLYPYRKTESHPNPPVPLIGTSDDFSFSAPGPHELSGHMLRYRVFLDRSGQSRALKLSWQEDTGTVPQSQTDASQETLLEDVDEAEFSYLASPASGNGGWASSWLDKPDAPMLVRVQLRLKGGAAGDWPTFVVKPRVTAPADCTFDPVSRRCR